MTSRVFNFSAGPAVLPESVLKQAQSELLSLPGHGMSILEVSHRGPEFGEVLAAAQANLRKLLAIPDGYQVLFLQGGGRLQFAMIPMNFITNGSQAEYIVTGSWGKKAMQEAQRIGATKTAFDNADEGYSRVPTPDELQIDANASYAYFTSNETIEGVQFPTEPHVHGVPLVCDASSDFLCRPLPIEKYGFLYACAQKNAGPAGVTIAIVRDDLLPRGSEDLPGYLNFRNHAANDSMYNTPPTFSIYIVNLVAQWLLDDIGGLAKMHVQNKQKASMLYDVIDSHPEFYSGHAAVSCRSIMNVTFKLPTDELTKQFVSEAGERQLKNLKGHRSVGGIRASIYNSMPVSGVEKLSDFMKGFAKKNS